MTTPQQPAGPLAGLRVLDLSRILAGPMAAMTLADLGAEVVKVERAGAGDDTRAWGPPYAEDGTATYFQTANRNKQSVALDFTNEDDLRVVRGLIRDADIAVDNFLPGALDRLGIGHDAMRELNPRIVTATISGFGSAGGASRPGYDFVVQALSGLMDVTGERDGAAMKVGVALVDILAAKDLTIGVLAALRHRDATGAGMHVEVNLLSSIQQALANQSQAVVGAGASPTRLGNMHPSICPYESLPCAEGELAVAVGNDKQFRVFARELGVPQLADDERFATNPLRVEHREELRPLLSEALAAKSAAEWQDQLVPAGLAVGKVNTIAEGIALAQDLGIDPVVPLERDGVASSGLRHPIRYTPEFPLPLVGPPALDADGDEIRARYRDTDAPNTERPSNV
ncbi:CaiB/BaiF CoA transferase family protein [Gulosibacter sediminis]|uniref:CaiB/BaiF CoA transferase family protein n=1 Tax=Gulosibacter sediminis TaxID=1729695 RepID=UPI0024AD6390|nr:CaiB/BaiF CoA-transferase family protein [Gulosibacter sediminis]